jgi:hypothetical protein
MKGRETPNGGEMEKKWHAISTSSSLTRHCTPLILARIVALTDRQGSERLAA